MHVTPLKRLVNVPLRFLQRPFTDRPLLLASVFVDGAWTGRYVWARMQMAPGWVRYGY
jgi:hypothetical protein